MMMRTVNYRDDVLYGICHLLGITPDADFSPARAAQFCAIAEDWIRKGWTYWDWPELRRTDERAFRTIWSASKTFYRQDAATGKPSELFYLPTFSYYAVLASAPMDPPAGTLPTDGTYFQPISLTDRYIDLDQPCRVAIGELLGVYDGNPRTNGGENVRGFRGHLSERGIDLGPWAGGNSVFIYYRIRRSKFVTIPYDNAANYTKGSLVYWTDGNVYRALSPTVGQTPAVPNIWAVVPFPERLVGYVKLGAASDLTDDLQTAGKLRGQAEEMIQQEINDLMAQGQQNFYQPFGAGSHRWFVSVPSSLAATADTTTLTDVCEDEGGGAGSATTQYLTSQDLTYIDSLRGLATSLDHLDTRYLLTLSKVRIVIGTPQLESTWLLETGAADPTYPDDQVDALNSDATAPARYWQKVGGY